MGEIQTIDVTNCNGNHCFKKEMVYEAATPQILALVESSSSCSQNIDFQCFSAPIKVCINKRLNTDLILKAKERSYPWANKQTIKDLLDGL